MGYDPLVNVMVKTSPTQIEVVPLTKLHQLPEPTQFPQVSAESSSPTVISGVAKPGPATKATPLGEKPKPESKHLSPEIQAVLADMETQKGYIASYDQKLKQLQAMRKTSQVQRAIAGYTKVKNDAMTRLDQLHKFAMNVNMSQFQSGMNSRNKQQGIQ